MLTLKFARCLGPTKFENRLNAAARKQLPINGFLMEVLISPFFRFVKNLLMIGLVTTRS